MQLAYVGDNPGFALHYAPLDHWTAVVMNSLMAVQTIAAIGFPLKLVPSMVHKNHCR